MDQKQLQQRFAEWQKITPFPGEYPAEFKVWVLVAISYHSPAGLKMEVQDYLKIVRSDPSEYNLWDLGAVFHILEIHTAHEMKMNLNEYCQFMEKIESMIKEWRNIVGPKSESLKREFEAKQRMEQENSGRTIEMAPVAQA